MVPFLRMLESQGLSLRDAEAGGRAELAMAVRRCQRCAEKAACIQWLEWRGRDARAPQCTIASYVAGLRARWG